MSDKLRAKEVLLEIIRQCGGDEIEGKTKLFKAFYFAHLFYAKRNAGFLSEWPIVKMPHGPGIERFDELIGELEKEGFVAVKSCDIGPYTATVYSLTEQGRRSESPEPEAMNAIRETVNLVEKETAGWLSNYTHEFSKTWNDAQDGEEMPIYLDLLDDKAYEAAKERDSRISSKIDSAWN